MHLKIYPSNFPMKKLKLLLLTYCCFFSYLAYSQQITNLDSLENIIKISSPDTNKVHLLCAYLEGFHRTVANKDSIKLRGYITEVDRLSEKLNFPIGKAHSYYMKALVADIMRDYPQIVANGMKASSIYEKYGYILHHAKTLRMIALGHYLQGGHKNSLFYIQKALKNYELADYKWGMALCMVLIGNTQAIHHKEEEALGTYLKGIAILKGTGLINESLLLNAGEMLMNKKRYDEALQLYQQSKAYMEKKKAFKHPGYAYSLFEIGNIYKAKQNYSEAIQNYLKSIAIYQEIDMTFGTPMIMNNLADIYKMQGSPDSTIKYAKESIVIAKKIKEPTLIKDSYLLLSEANQLKKNYLLAYEFYLKHSHLKDSLFTIEKTKEVSAIQTQFETERKDQQIKVQKGELKLLEADRNTKILIIISLFLILIFIAGVFAFTNYRKNQKIKDKEKKEKLLLTENDLKQAQINSELAEKKHLETELALKTQQLDSYTKQLLQKNELLEKLNQQMTENKSIVNSEHLANLQKLIEGSLYNAKDWQNFFLHFSEVYPRFFAGINKKFPQLTTNDHRHCALIKLKLAPKEISSLLGIEHTTIYKNRYRLAQKMEISADLLDEEICQY